MSPHDKETHKEGRFMGAPQQMDGGPQILSFSPQRKWRVGQQIISYPLPKTQTMAQHRKEMMAQVKQMPEETYELSLRDIVELPKAVLEICPDKEQESRMEKAKEEEKGDKSKRARKWKDGISVLKMIRSGVSPSKLLFSNHFHVKRKSATVAAQVSPKPVLCKGEQLMMAEASEAEYTSSTKIGCYPFLPMNRGHFKASS